MPITKFIYGGISGVEFPNKEVNLGEGIVLRSTYAHLMSPCMMAFSRPGPHGHHPTPWKAAHGGFSYDIEVEIKAPIKTVLGETFDGSEIVWWIAALLRLSKFPFLTVPVLSDQSYSSILHCEDEPVLTPFEIEQRIFQPVDTENRILDDSTLDWIKEIWIPAGQLLNAHPKFYSAMKAFDSASIRGRTSASLLAIWGGLEQLFAPSSGELRFRVASLLASFLEQDGHKRHILYKRILKLYNQRSTAAHTAKDIEIEPLAESYVLMRNALIKIIDENKIPTLSDLETMLFRYDDNDNDD